MSDVLQITRVELQNAKVNKIESAELHIGSHKHKISSKSANGVLSEKFNPPLNCALQDALSLTITKRKRWPSRGRVVSKVPISRDLREVSARAIENKVSLKVHEDLTVVLEISRPTSMKSLIPTTVETLDKCPRFRILVIGKTGVGKTSLINYAFGITDAVKWTKHPSDNRRGVAEINKPLTSDANERFVLHDSNGFEPGEDSNLAAVESFIKEHKNQTAIGSQLHAVWLCFQTPLEQYGERMMESGAENFLREKQGILGNIPTICVFTKYDMLAEAIEKEWIERQKDYEVEDVDREAELRLRKMCVLPIQDITKEGPIPYAAVSTRIRFKAKLEQLIQLTQEEILARSPQQNEPAGVDPAAALALAIAQRVEPGLKIKGSIEYVVSIVYSMTL
ncbi:hypothetical protein ID866_8626 [Astraeus odoratus]|nr:hypothetical protein ID866_8626 [Astraeus odoratus]